MGTDTSHSSLLDKQILAVDLHQPGTHGPLGGSTDDSAGGHVELTAVAGARYRGAIQHACRERTSRVSTSVIKRIQTSGRMSNVDLGSRDIKDLHLPR